VKFRVLAEAEAELLEAARYYEDRQIGLGAEFYQQVAECMETIAQNPLRFPFYGRSSSQSGFPAGHG
jgi:hypothetical protein